MWSREWKVVGGKEERRERAGKMEEGHGRLLSATEGKIELEGVIRSRGEDRREDNRCGVDSRTTMDMCSMQNRNSQLRHNHVVPALTGRCICV